MIDSCDWSHPSADAYMGTPRAAIMAMAEIPAPIRLALVARAEAHDYDDTVYIDRDAIRSPKHAYDPAIRSMAFGSLGRTCRNVTRAGWAASRLEAAWVYCDSGWCVAMPAVCRNFFIATRLPAAPAIRPGDDGSPVASLGDEPAIGAPIDGPATAVVDAFDAPQPLIADPQMPSGPVGIPMGQPALADGSVGPAFNTFNGGAGYAYGGATFPGVPFPVVAVAEPSTYALILAGLAVLALVKRRKT